MTGCKIILIRYELISASSTNTGMCMTRSHNHVQYPMSQTQREIIAYLVRVIKALYRHCLTSLCINTQTS